METPPGSPVMRKSSFLTWSGLQDPDEPLPYAEERRQLRPLTEKQIFNLVRDLPQPPVIGRPMYLTVERVARMRPLARYIVRMDHPRHPMFLCFRHLMEPMTGAVVRRIGSDQTRAPVVAGAIVMRHAGAPGGHPLAQPFYAKWKLMGEVFDTHTKPWTVVRKLQLSATIPEGHFQLVDPDNMVIINLEVIYMR